MALRYWLLIVSMAVAFGLGFALIWHIPADWPGQRGAMFDKARTSTLYRWRGTVLLRTPYQPGRTAPPRQMASAPPPAGAPSSGRGDPWPAGAWRPQRASLPAFPPSGVRTRPLTQLVAFESAPFPYEGIMPRSQRPFLNHTDEDGHRAHKTRSGRIYRADRTYGDNRVLIHMPKGFDLNRPAVMVLFFHGHGATLTRDVMTRQRLPAQISESGVNAVLVAPQFAVNARDSSAGKFWEPGGMRRFLDETAEKLAKLDGTPWARREFANMPVVIVGYSGGYMPTAWALAKGGITKRVKGVVLLDALYGEIGKFAHWITHRRSGFFLSVYTHSTERGNLALKELLTERNLSINETIPQTLAPGSITFIAADEPHRSYVTHAWTKDPVADMLERLTDTAKRAQAAQSASLAPARDNRAGR